MSNPHCLSMFVSPKLNPKSQLPNQPKHYFLFTVDSNAKEATSFAATLTDSRRIVAKKAVACCQHLPAFPKQKLNPFIQLFTWSLKWFPTVQLSWFAPIGIHHCRPLRHLRKSIQSSPKPKKWLINSKTASQSSSTGFQAMNEFLEMNWPIAKQDPWQLIARPA